MTKMDMAESVVDPLGALSEQIAYDLAVQTPSAWAALEILSGVLCALLQVMEENIGRDAAVKAAEQTFASIIDVAFPKH